MTDYTSAEGHFTHGRWTHGRWAHDRWQEGIVARGLDALVVPHAEAAPLFQGEIRP
ncbi:hypothetical protein FBZ89_104341 [Nitrospirillum amazonense]|uniref:Uncharacterized protein n=1 Tax=Nitrospirillum amazonense TaxID=28077 RepID=A0A560FKF9_9PROT|nr:hypothetical protein [Nitrospirillum amazonense]TWB22092.1 hypothetical protein FBZ89_104341 [Nitrospirillum amazonense]